MSESLWIELPVYYGLVLKRVPWRGDGKRPELSKRHCQHCPCGRGYIVAVVVVIATITVEDCSIESDGCESIVVVAIRVSPTLAG